MQQVSNLQLPPTMQAVDQGAPPPPPIFREGFIYPHAGYLKRRTAILKRWKREWFCVVPGKLYSGVSSHEHADILVEVEILKHSLHQCYCRIGRCPSGTNANLYQILFLLQLSDQNAA